MQSRFPRAEEAALMWAYKHDEPPPLSQKIHGITPHCDDVMRAVRALGISPADGDAVRERHPFTTRHVVKGFTFQPRSNLR
ncbi:hypothetical protein [Streptomyces sp. NPDC002156]